MELFPTTLSIKTSCWFKDDMETKYVVEALSNIFLLFNPLQMQYKSPSFSTMWHSLIDLCLIEDVDEDPLSVEEKMVVIISQFQ
jgi:hypothetical protein